MKNLPSHGNDLMAEPYHSPKEWDQIEDPEEVKLVLDRLRQATRFDVYSCAELYDLAYPGYRGDTGYYADRASRATPFTLA